MQKIHTGDVHELLQLKNNFSIEINIIEEVLLINDERFIQVLMIMEQFPLC